MPVSSNTQMHIRAARDRVLVRTGGRLRPKAILSWSQALRCVLFHHVSDRPSPFTDGLGIRCTPRAFEKSIRFLARHYTPISLDALLSTPDWSELPPRSVLVTFDDAYASVAEVAAEICATYKVPAAFFVNAAFVDSRDLALDNLVCYVTNRAGFNEVRRAVSDITRAAPSVTSASRISREVLPVLGLEQRRRLRKRLAVTAGIDPVQLAGEARLYVSAAQLSAIQAMGFEIGNHTWSHVYCRHLTGGDLETEIAGNQRALESIVGRSVRGFSLPYGSSRDLTPAVIQELDRTGHRAAFLSESLPNTAGADRFRVSRTSLHRCSSAGLFSEIEVLPHLRQARDYLTGASSSGVRSGPRQQQRQS